MSKIPIGNEILTADIKNADSVATEDLVSEVKRFNEVFGGIDKSFGNFKKNLKERYTLEVFDAALKFVEAEWEKALEINAGIIIMAEWETSQYALMGDFKAVIKLVSNYVEKVEEFLGKSEVLAENRDKLKKKN